MGASIRGQVKKTLGQPLSKVVVKAAHEPTGSTFAKKTDAEGFYLFDRLKAGGPYVLSVTGERHSLIEIQGIHLKIGESLVQDIVQDIDLDNSV